MARGGMTLHKFQHFEHTAPLIDRNQRLGMEETRMKHGEGASAWDGRSRRI